MTGRIGGVQDDDDYGPRAGSDSPLPRSINGRSKTVTTSVSQPVAGSLVNSVLAEGAGFISLTVPNPIVPQASPGITGSSSVSLSSLTGPDIGAVPLTEVNRIRESVSVPVLGLSTVQDGPISSDSRPLVGYSLARMTCPEPSLCYLSAHIRQSGTSPTISGRPPLGGGGSVSLRFQTDIGAVPLTEVIRIRRSFSVPGFGSIYRPMRTCIL